MKRTAVFVLAFLLCASVVIADSGISIGKAEHMDERIRVDITNSNDFDIDNARVRAYIPELGIMTQSSAVDLDDDNTISAALNLLEEVPEGEYLVRISVKKAGIRRVVYRYVYFG